VAAVARRQHGVVDHADLIAIGLSPAAIGRWSAQGQLHRVHRGVYAVGHAVLTELGRSLAAVKACGPGAVLSLHPDDVALIDGVPVTSVARTLLDLADVLQPRQLIRAIEQAERLARTKTLREAIAAVTGDPPRTNSDWERDLLALCDDHDIPRPELNVLVNGYEVDALWRTRKIVVELDSYAFHRSRRAFEQDRDKYADLQLAGYLVLPLTRLNEPAARGISAAIAGR
jgi:hypothetical protein